MNVSDSDAFLASRGRLQFRYKEDRDDHFFDRHLNVVHVKDLPKNGLFNGEKIDEMAIAGLERLRDASKMAEVLRLQRYKESLILLPKDKFRNKKSLKTLELRPPEKMMKCA